MASCCSTIRASSRRSRAWRPKVRSCSPIWPIAASATYWRPTVFSATWAWTRSKTPPAEIPAAVAAVESDFDRDGRADVALIAGDGSLHLLQNATETHNNWLLAGLNGVKNMKLAPGAKVEIKTGSSYQKRIYRGVPLLFGVDSYKIADAVRITWPNGLIQNEAEQPVDKAIEYQEAQRLSGSCPMIFTWDGGKFRFITDVLGVAP